MTRRPVHREELGRPSPGEVSPRGDTAAASPAIRARTRRSGSGVGGGGGGGEGPRSVAARSAPGVSPLSPDSVGASEPRVAHFHDSVGAGAPASEAPDPTPGVSPGRAAYESLIALCRRDVDAFCEFVLRDEETGQKVEQAPLHTEMQREYASHRYLLVMAHPESGKTQQLVVARTLHELGTNPRERHVFLNNGQDGAKKSLGAVKKYVERSEELRAVFPRLRPGGTWREDAVVVEGAELGAKDPSIAALGFHGNVTGSRVDRAKVDDLLDYENTRTEQARQDAETWFRRSFLSRLTEKATCAFLTNAWDEQDLAHALEADGWRTLRYPILDSRGKSTWPARWSLSRIAETRRRVGELEFARMFLCEPRDPGAQSFRPEWLRSSLRRGVGYGILESLPEAPPGSMVVTGVDLGASRRLSGGATTMFTLLVRRSGLRQLIAARSGRWSGGAIIRNLADVGERYGGVIVVEDNGVQRHLVELANEEGADVPVPVLPFYTGRNKYDLTLGVDAMAAEFEAERWLLPSGRTGRETAEETRRLLGELRAYAPGTHPGDRLMAVWFARTWAVRRLRQLQRPTAGGVRAVVYG